MASATDEYLTVTEAATMLKVSQSTIWRSIKRGDLPAHRVGQRGIRVRRRDLVGPAEHHSPMRILTSMDEIRALEPISDETRRQWDVAIKQAERHSAELLRKRHGRFFSFLEASERSEG